MLWLPLATVKFVEPLVTETLLPAASAGRLTGRPKFAPSISNCTEPVGFSPVPLASVILAVKLIAWPLTTEGDSGVTPTLVLAWDTTSGCAVEFPMGAVAFVSWAVKL